MKNKHEVDDVMNLVKMLGGDVFKEPKMTI